MITSIKNEKVKSWRKLHKRKGRMDADAFLLEGTHLIEEAWKSKQQILEIIAEESFELPAWIKDYPIEMVTGQVFKQISQTAAPQGIAAVVAMPENNKITGNQLLLIDAVQDPGNLGTLIRTADAAGMGGIVLGKGTVDLYNDKVVRATQGSIFHIPIYEADLLVETAILQEAGFEIWATALEQSEKYNDISVPEKIAIIMGNEGAGVDEALLEKADQRVMIPIYGKAESLNVAIAAAILMYQIKN